MRVASGPYAGNVAMVMTATPPPPAHLARRPPPAPVPRPPLTEVQRHVAAAHSARSRRTAERLLESLLDPAQLDEWRTTSTFWVDTPFGSVRLGQLYDLRYRPRGGRGSRGERSLCVVPIDHLTLPPADIWVNLLLFLRTDPRRFFAVAIENPMPPPRRLAGPTVRRTG